MHLTVITMLVDCRLNRIISRFFSTERTSEILILAINNQKIAMQSIVEIIVEQLPLQSTPERFLLSATKQAVRRVHIHMCVSTTRDVATGRDWALSQHGYRAEAMDCKCWCKKIICMYRYLKKEWQCPWQ